MCLECMPEMIHRAKMAGEIHEARHPEGSQHEDTGIEVLEHLLCYVLDNQARLMAQLVTERGRRHRRTR